MPENSFRVAVIALLIALVGLQALILRRLPEPVTIASIMATPENKRADLMNRVSCVRVQGGFVNADIQNTVDVDVQNTVAVDIQNTPIAIEFDR